MDLLFKAKFIYTEINIEKENIIIGKIGFTKYDNLNQLIITNFEIFEEYRNKGYGTEVILAVITTLNYYDLIVCDVDINNEAAIRFYERLGEVLKDEIVDNTYRVILYEKGKEHGI